MYCKQIHSSEGNLGQPHDEDMTSHFDAEGITREYKASTGKSMLKLECSNALSSSIVPAIGLRLSCGIVG